MISTKASWVGGKHFGDWLESARADQAIVVQAGVAAATEGFRDDLRDDVAQGGLGSKLGNAVGANVYPRDPKGSLDAAGYVFPRGRKATAIFDAFNSGSVITAKHGKYLAIPTANAGKAARFAKTSPVEFQQRTGIKLNFVKFRNGSAGLVGKATLQKHARGVRGSRNSLVYFILIPAARMPVRLHFEAKAQQWADRIPDLIDAARTGVSDG